MITPIWRDEATVFGKARALPDDFRYGLPHEPRAEIQAL
jgi:hypothetical protein